jgi:hypothetical protein
MHSAHSDARSYIGVQGSFNFFPQVINRRICEAYDEDFLGLNPFFFYEMPHAFRQHGGFSGARHCDHL